MDLTGNLLGPNLPIGRVSIFNLLSSFAITNIFSIKTKVQQRALAGEKYRTTWETLHRLIRGKFGKALSVSLIL